MAFPLALALLAGLGGAGKGFVEEERAQEEMALKTREQKRKEEETIQRQQQNMFERTNAATTLTLNTLKELPNISLGLRPVFVDSMFDAIKKLGGTPDKVLRDVLVTQAEQFAPAYQRSLETGQLDPLIAAMDPKIVKSVQEDMESAKQTRAFKAIAPAVRGIGTAGAEASARALERGVDPGKAGIGQVPIFPPEGRTTSATIRTAVINELNWREANEAAKAAGQPAPPAPAPGEVDTASLTKEQLIFLAGADDPAVAIQQVISGARALKPGAPRPATPAPSPAERKGGTPTGAGTGGGALPGRGGAVPTGLPPADKHKGRIIRDTESGARYKSDGTKWNEVR